MFRRLPSGLPEDPVFPTDFKSLGYFQNEDDEIRSIENPKAYFKFFLNKNERYNVMQREGMNEAIRQLVQGRLKMLDLNILRLPLGATKTEPHVPIFISDHLKRAKRVIVLFYEHTQDLGIFAHRVIGGKGGINAGSAVGFVKYLEERFRVKGGPMPAVVLANCGQLRWSRRHKKAMTQVSWYAMPQKSCVDPPYHFDEKKNTIRGNRSTFEHVSYIFNNVLANPDLCDQEAEIQVIGVSDGAVQASIFLENPDNFTKWCETSRIPQQYLYGIPKPVTLAMEGAYTGRVTAFASLGTYYHAQEMHNEKFKAWFADRGRVYVVSEEPAGQFIAPPEGAKNTVAYGAPVFSAGEPYYSELLLIKGHKDIVAWFEEVSDDDHYHNPNYERLDIVSEEEDEDEDLKKFLWGNEDPPGAVEDLVEEDEAAGEVQDVTDVKIEEKAEIS